MPTLSPSLLAFTCGAFLALTGAALAQPAPVPGPAAPPPAAPPTPPPAAPAPAPAAAPPATAPPPGMEPLAPTPLDPPKINVGIPEPEPEKPRTVQRHEGFYTRASIGPVYGGTKVSTDSSTHSDYWVDGFGLEFDLLMGGSPSVGFATGGALSLQGFGGDGQSSGLVLVGAFVDGFPSAAQGFHFGGQAGLAYVTTGTKNNIDEMGGLGAGVSFWFGHGFWVADDWSLGGLLRFNGAIAWDGSGGGPNPAALRATTYDVGLLVSVTYH